MIEAPPTPIITSVRRLRAMRDELQGLRKARQLTSTGVEALAECNFRIALDPDTDIVESLALLREAVRIDGANPKYSYHLARIHFAHGDLDTAATWLFAAVRLCPTSHRLWAHVALLQQELNARYKGDDQFEPDALRERAEEVETSIADGSDGFDPKLLGFTPPMSKAQQEKLDRQTGRTGQSATATAEAPPAYRPVKRLTRAKACRWSGVHDMRVEQLLLAKPTKRGLSRLVPLLTRAAESASKRTGGPAGFCTLGVLWLVAGYPVATIRRLAAVACPRGPAHDLLNTVCELYQAPLAELPARLAAARAAGKLPPLLAAVIHRRRVLYRPLEFRAMAALRTARRLVNEARVGTGGANADKEATDLARRLINAIEALYPAPPDELKDEAPTAKRVVRDPAALIAAFTALEQAAVSLEQLRDKAFQFLKGDLDPRAKADAVPAVLALALADHDAFVALIDAFLETGKRGDAQVESIVQELSGHAGAAPEGFQNARDECQKKFRGVQALPNFKKVLGRIDTRLTPARGSTPPAGAPSPALADILASVRSAVPAEVQAGADVAAGESGDPAAAVTTLGKHAEEMAATLNTDWARVRDLVATHKRNSPPLTEAERAEAAALKSRVEGILARSKVLLEEVATLRSGGQVPPAMIGALDAAEKGLLALGDRNGPFRKNFTTLQLADASPPAAAPAPAASASSAPGAATPNSAAAAAAAAAVAAGPTPPPAERTGVAGLKQVLAYTEREIGRAFTNAEESFAPYSAEDMTTAGLAALHWTVLARKAETLYRIGRRAEARRVWSRLLRLDPLDPGVLQNVAVCDTASGEPARCLAAWKSYVEVLYFFDVVADDPRPHAQVRADLHRAIGHSYAPPAVHKKADDWLETLDPVTVIGFLSSPGGVRNFVGHKLLEYFNIRLLAESPPIIVGIGRSDPHEARDRAADRWEEFQKSVEPDLPARVRTPVGGVVRRHVQKAVEECGNVTRLAQKRDPTYGDDRKRLLELVIDFCQTKFRLGLLLVKSADLAGQLATFDGLVELLRLDEAPVDANPELFEAVAAKLGMPADRLRRLLPHYALQFIFGAMLSILDNPTDDADATRRRDLYGRMVAQVAPHPAMKDAAVLMDAPYLYTELTKKWLPDDTPESRIPVFRRWLRSFPAMAGVALGLAQQLLKFSHGGGPERAALENEAIQALEIGASKGFHGPSVSVCVRQLIAIKQGQGNVAGAIALAEQYRDNSTSDANRAVLARMCLQLRFQAAVEEMKFEDAIRIGLELMEDDDRDFAQVQNLIQVFDLAAKKTHRDPGRRKVVAAVTAWADRARSKWDKHNNDEDAVTPETIARVLAQRDDAVVQSVVAEHTDASNTIDYRALVGGLNTLLTEFPDLPGAYYQRMNAWEALSEDATSDAEKAENHSKAVADAKIVRARSTNPDHKKAAAELLKSGGDDDLPEGDSMPDDA